MAKRNWFGDAFNLAGIAQSAYTYLIGVAGVSAVTGFWAYTYQGLHWALFLGFGVLFFGALTVIFVREYARTQNTSNKLIVASVDISQRGQVDDTHAWYRPSITFRNLAPYELHFEVIEFECLFGQEASRMDRTERLNGILPANDTGSLSFPAVKATPADMITGRLLVKAKFGRTKEQLKETLETTLRVSCLASGNLEYVGVLETLRNTLRLEHGGDD